MFSYVLKLQAADLPETKRSRENQIIDHSASQSGIIAMANVI